MAPTKLPTALDRRHLVERELAPAEALRYAEAYAEQERWVEAVDFFAKAGADDRLAEVADLAVAEGDAFLLKIVAAAQGDDPGSERWQQLAEAAARAGRDEYAETARRLAGVGED